MKIIGYIKNMAFIVVPILYGNLLLKDSMVKEAEVARKDSLMCEMNCMKTF